jgi:hypothetical protein
MRLSSPDEDSSTFRSLKIGLTKEDRKYADIVDRLRDKHEYLNEATELVDKMNKLFRTSCKGLYKYKYRLCIDEDIHPSGLSISSSSRKRILLRSHELNDELSKLKTKFEKELSDI